MMSSSTSSSLSHLAVSLWAWHRAANRLSRSKVIGRVRVVWVPTEQNKQQQRNWNGKVESGWKRELTICSFAIPDLGFHQALLKNYTIII